MKKILCPTDFSDSANEAIVYTAKLCKKLGAEMTLLNVQSVFSLPVTEAIKGKFKATQPIRVQLEEKSYEVMKVFKVTCRSEVDPTNRNLSDVIAEHARNFDLIIMGTNGADDFYQYFFGSHSYQVVKDTSTPVMIIPDGCGYRDISNIIFAYDFEGEQKVPLAQLSEWAKLMEATVTVLQVKKHFSHEVDINSKEIERNSEMNEDIPGLKFDTIYGEEVGKSIHNYVLRNEADVLALCSAHRTLVGTIFHNSIIKELSVTAKYPLFVFHE